MAKFNLNTKIAEGKTVKLTNEERSLIDLPYILRSNMSLSNYRYCRNCGVMYPGTLTYCPACHCDRSEKSALSTYFTRIGEIRGKIKNMKSYKLSA